MTELTRRRFGAFFVALGATTALAACTTTSTTTSVTVSTIATYADEVLAGLQAFVASASVTGLLSADQLSTINSDISAAETVVSEITASASTIDLTTAQGWVQVIEDAADSAISILSGIGALPATATSVISAIEVVLPVLLAAVSLTGASAKATAGGLTLPQAQTILTNPKI